MIFCEQLSACIWSEQHDRTSHLPSSQTITQLILEKRGGMGVMKLVLRVSTALVFHWICSFHPFSGAIEGEFLRSVAHVLVVSFRAKIENCLCGKSRSGTWSVLVTGPVSPITAFPGQSLSEGILHLLCTCCLFELSTVFEQGQI